MALLTYLALEARAHPVSRATLVELLWGDASPARARHSLSQALTAIRGAFGVRIVRKVGEAIQFVAPLTTDLDLADWGGWDIAHPLNELDACAGADFAHWVEGLRERCVRAARVKLVAAIECARTSGDVAAVHERATTLYAVDPMSEIAAQAIAERYLVEGDKHSAIRFLRTHLERAENELGKLDHSGLKRMLRHIETGGSTSPPGLPVPAGFSDRPSRADVFVGRETELRQLEISWAAARGGALQTCLLTGPRASERARYFAGFPPL